MKRFRVNNRRSNS